MVVLKFSIFVTVLHLRIFELFLEHLFILRHFQNPNFSVLLYM